MSSFVLQEGVVYHTYSAYLAVSTPSGMFQWLDRAPKGRNESCRWYRNSATSTAANDLCESGMGRRPGPPSARRKIRQASWIPVDWKVSISPPPGSARGPDWRRPRWAGLRTASAPRWTGTMW